MKSIKDEERVMELEYNLICEFIKLRGELDESTSIGISDKSSGGRKPRLYNLDMIIGIDYRVKSKNGIIFRKWANKVLKDYLLKGYAFDKKRLNYLEKTINLINIVGRIDNELNGTDAKEIIKIINNYSYALNLLDDYDHKRITKPLESKNDKQITYEDCMDIVSNLKFNSDSDLFALERNQGLKSM